MAARVGLTGGIGSGKSTVAGEFTALGVTVIDADRVAHRLSEPGAACYREIISLFGTEVVGKDKRLDRKRIGDIVFASADKRRQLEAILHPAIRDDMFQRAREDSGCYCILDIPLLIESGQHLDVDRVLVVACSREVRIERLVRHRQMSRQKIENIMASQASDREREAAAHDIIDNEGPLDSLPARVKALDRKYRELFAC